MDETVERVALLGIAPIVPVRRVARSIDFYAQVLGFSVRERDARGTFAYVERGGVGLMLLDLDDYRSAKATSEYFSSYVWVADVDALHAELAPALERLPEGRWTPVRTKPDGRREFHVTDPDGFLLFFGEPAG
jgi:catechol 2,3-dioxygenase-like lactoylglutathione lyase family enzyme